MVLLGITAKGEEGDEKQLTQGIRCPQVKDLETEQHRTLAGTPWLAAQAPSVIRESFILSGGLSPPNREEMLPS